MKTLMKMAVILSLAVSSAWSAQRSSFAGDAVGVREITVPSQERHRDITATVWYPAKVGGRPVMLGESRYFTGTPAMENADISPRRYPLILLSHGAGLAGTPSALSWFAVPLARHGFIVAAPMHPGNGGANKSASETMKMWLRPKDISSTLDAIDNATFFHEHLEPENVGMVGLSMGGGTALALGGARFSPERLASYCDTQDTNPSLCEWVNLSGVNLHDMDLTPAARDGRDTRIRAIMAIDPAPVDVFSTSSFSRISAPISILNLGRPSELPLTLRADTVAQAIPGALYSTIENASHYSMFPECKPGALSSAEAKEIGDPICSDGRGRSRAIIHAELVSRTVRFFNETLKAGRSVK